MKRIVDTVFRGSLAAVATIPLLYLSVGLLSAQAKSLDRKTDVSNVTGRPGHKLTAKAKPARQRRALPVYRIQPGDTLIKLASQYLGNKYRWTEIYALNRHKIASYNKLQPGMLIHLPRDAKGLPGAQAKPAAPVVTQPTPVATPSLIPEETEIEVEVASLMPVPAPLPSAPVLPPMAPQSPESIPAEAGHIFGNRLQLFYQPALISEKLISRQVLASGQAVNGWGAHLQLRPLNWLLIEGHYNFSNFLIHRPATQEQTERNAHQATLGAFRLLELPVADRQLDLALGVSLDFDAHAGQESQQEGQLLREQDHFDAQYQFFSPRAKAIAGYRPLMDYPWHLYAGAAYGPALLLTPEAVGLGLPLWSHHLTGQLGSLLKVESFALGLQYSLHYQAGVDYQRLVHQFHLTAGYAF